MEISEYLVDVNLAGGYEYSVNLMTWERRVLPLTNRELGVLRLIATGMSAKEAARELGIAPRTIERHLDHIRLKTRTRNRSHLLVYAMSEGLI